MKIDEEDFSMTSMELELKYTPDGHWGQHPYFTLVDWRFEVYEGDTLRGYWDWVRSSLEILRG